MDKTLLIACDLHDTLLKSKDAWEIAFSELSGIDRKVIREVLNTKISRHVFAKQIGLDYGEVYRKYYNLVEINTSVCDTIALLCRNHNAVLISAASRIRVAQDVQKLNGIIQFNQIYTKETFRKNHLQDWIQLRTTFSADRIFYIGNDPLEDVICADFVQSFLIPTSTTEAVNDY